MRSTHNVVRRPLDVCFPCKALHLQGDRFSESTIPRMRRELCGRFVLLLVLAGSLSGFCIAQPSHNARVPTGTYLQIVPHKYSLNDSAIPRAVLDSLNRPLSQTFKDAKGRVWQATQRGLVEINPANDQERVLTGKDGCRSCR